ncbi:diguanylate cyclase (GGDEF) domain-containing protein [Lachnospiraceae bacterium NE2001]|nr:diguanylate cyclase (GGDEF) domain-containing protein [Lachnospiraceae bacterium NE2001]
MINGKKLIALCTSRIYDPQIHGFIEKLNERLQEKEFSLLIFAINSDIYWDEDRPAAEKYVFDIIPYEYLDAVIIMDEKIKSHRIAEKIISCSNQAHIPVIICDGHYKGASSIRFDYEKGFELICRHIIEDHKVKRPHMMAGQPYNDFSNRRIDVFKKVLADNDIDFDDSMISYGYFWSDPCRVATQELLDRGNLPEAVICANDAMAITVSEMLQEAGYKVPEDVIISGFDGYDAIFFASPKISSSSCDIILLADATADVIFESIQNKEIQERFITPVLIPNESCGCPEYNAHPDMLQDWFRESFSRHNDDNRVLQMMSSFMQTSQSLGEMLSHLDCYKTEHSLIVVDRNCFNGSENYFADNNNQKKKDFVLIYDSEFADRYKENTFNLPESSFDRGLDSSENVLTPSIRDRILELTESGYPIIFNSLNVMNKPFGFICYYFPDSYINNYSNTMTVTGSVSNGIGGYINMEYQRTLLKQMDEMYRHDPLTGLLNRMGFQNEFKRICQKGTYGNSEITVIMSDLDGLKYINDHFGHADGDNAIEKVAKALHGAVPENSLSTRFGGDEVFSVIFGKCDPDAIISKIDGFLENYNMLSGRPYKVETSSGYITTTLDENFDITQAVKDADEKMYNVKSSKYAARGRNVYTSP